MRRILASFAVLALGLPAAAFAARTASDDGAFSLTGGRGTFTVYARGGVIGSFARGRVIITDPLPGDGTGPIVSGDDWSVVKTDTTTVYGGTHVRFRLLGGLFKIRVIGGGVNLSVVGKGQVTLNGAGTPDDGTYSFNGDIDVPVPPVAVTFPLNASTP